MIFLDSGYYWLSCKGGWTGFSVLCACGVRLLMHKTYKRLSELIFLFTVLLAGQTKTRSFEVRKIFM